jgi:hypothetical protein
LAQAWFLSFLSNLPNTLGMEATTSVITVSELKKLLFSIVDNEDSVCIRYRTIGQLWYPNFLRVVKIVADKRVMFYDEIRERLISIPDLSTIIQFELDGRVYHFEPNCHYHVSDHFKDH